MILNLWKYLKGYVIIEVTGFSVSRFVNLAVHKGIYIWDVSHEKDRVIMKVSVKGFKLLKPCAKKTKCKFKIIEKKGLPFFAFRYRKRKIFVAGFVFFIAFVYFLSSFIWLVEVDGTDRISQEDIIRFSEEHGLRVGGLKFGINRRELEAAMINEFPYISFINIGIRGTKATISIAETIPPQEILDRSAPSDIIAKRDGVIMGVHVSTGTAIVREFDVVSEGDLLVSGHLTVSEDRDPEGLVNTHTFADAIVLARYYYPINFEVEREYIQKNFTGNTKNRRRFILFGREINLFSSSISYTNYDKIRERTQLRLGENYPLPFIIVTDRYFEFEPIVSQKSLVDMQEEAAAIVTNRIIREFDFGADVFEKIINLEETERGLSVSATIITIEDIGKNVRIEIPEQLETPLEDEEIE
ncbi:MAG: sporulation protein YqfD [Defluviitaleaceae bacterium]|nr:sporulation protein YqfD [Defluviitaleaceae bacterium]